MKKLLKAIKPRNCVVFFDFDNTIAAFDVFDDMVLRFSADNRWMALEELWKQGKIGSRECLEGQLECVKFTRKELEEYLSSIRLDPYFKKLLKLLKSKKVKTLILSDNFDHILKNILRHNGIRGIKVFSNKLRFVKNRIVTSFPFADKDCRACAHCKKGNLLANVDRDSMIIYIGDGHSDICPAKYADIVFAKDSLLKHFRDRNLKHLPYKRLKDVYGHLKKSFV